MGEYATLRRQSCTRKKVYTRKRVAQAVADRFGPPCHVYFCIFCAYWHVGRYGKTADLIERQRPTDALRAALADSTEVRE